MDLVEADLGGRLKPNPLTGTPRTARRSDAGPLDLPALPAESRIKAFG